jgi:hypothetical protein
MSPDWGKSRSTRVAVISAALVLAVVAALAVVKTVGSSGSKADSVVVAPGSASAASPGLPSTAASSAQPSLAPETTALLGTVGKLDDAIVDGLVSDARANKLMARTRLRSLPFVASSLSIHSNTGIALAAADSYLVSHDARDLALAVRSFNLLIADQSQPNGALHSVPSGADIDTMFFAANLGVATLLLGEELNAPTRAAWTKAVVGAAQFLIDNGNLTFYTNGNIVVGNTLVEALAFKLDGSSKYQQAYRSALDFAVDPGTTQFKGRGFVVTRAGAAADGSDGAGYFTETGATSTGFDPDYTMLQSEQLARLYLVTEDPAVLRLLNMVTNALLPRVNRTDWMMDGSGGTRHDYKIPEPFDSSAVVVLGYRGGRTDLRPLAASEIAAIDKEFRHSLTYSPKVGDRGYYAIGMISSSLIMALQG